MAMFPFTYECLEAPADERFLVRIEDDETAQFLPVVFMGPSAKEALDKARAYWTLSLHPPGSEQATAAAHEIDWLDIMIKKPAKAPPSKPADDLIG